MFTGGITDDLFIGQTSTIQSGDRITGGLGVNQFDIYLDNSTAGANNMNPMNVSNVQNFFIQNTGADATANLRNIDGAQQIWNSESSAALLLTNAQTSQTFGVSDTNSATDVTFLSGQGTGQTLNLALADAGTKSSMAFIGAHAGNTTDKVSTVTVSASGDSYITLANYAFVPPTSASDLDTNNLFSTFKNLTIGGDGFVSIENAGAVSGGDASTALNALTTVDGSENTGGFTLDITGNSKNVTVTGGSGDDTVEFGATYFDAADVIDLGEGVNTLIVGDQLDVSSSAQLAKDINAAKNVDILGTSADTATSISSAAFSQTIFAATASTITGGANAAASGGAGSGATGTAGENGLTFTFDNDDAVVISATSIIGQVGGRGSAGASGGSGGGTGGEGGDAVALTARVDSGISEVFLEFTATSAITLNGASGGAGGASGAGTSGGEAGENGVSLNASTVEVLNISSVSSSGDVDFVHGIAVGANATIILSGPGDIDLSRNSIVSITSADNLVVDGSAMTGAMTAVTGDGNDIIKGGSGSDTMSGRDGVNFLTGGSGKDSFQFVEADSIVTSLTTITDFTAGLGGDTFKVFTSASNLTSDTSAVVYTLVTLTAAQQNVVSSEASLSAAYSAVLGYLTTEDTVAGFTYGGTTYVAFDGTSSADTLVKVTGLDVTSLVQSNFIS